MKIRLYTLTPGKLQTLFPEIGYPQFRLTQKLYKTLGDTWIERALEIFAGGGYKELGNKVGYGQKSVVEALDKTAAPLSRNLSSIQLQLYR